MVTTTTLMSESVCNTSLAAANLSTQTPNTTIIILPNGTTIYSASNVATASATAGKLYTKEMRTKLTTKDLLTFCAVVSYKKQEPFRVINFNVKDPKQIVNKFTLDKTLQ